MKIEELDRELVLLRSRIKDYFGFRWYVFEYGFSYLFYTYFAGVLFIIAQYLPFTAESFFSVLALRLKEILLSVFSFTIYSGVLLVLYKLLVFFLFRHMKKQLAHDRFVNPIIAVLSESEYKIQKLPSTFDYNDFKRHIQKSIKQISVRLLSDNIKEREKGLMNLYSFSSRRTFSGISNYIGSAKHKEQSLLAEEKHSDAMKKRNH